jgi:hypothetical protein
MFSSDVAKIRVAELKAAGDAGTIQRLRKSCADIAAVLESTAVLLTGKPLSKEVRTHLANELRRGASSLRSIANVSAPKAAK